MKRAPDPGERGALARLADELVQRNVNAIAELEEAGRLERTRFETWVDAFTASAGSVPFLAVNAAAYLGWIAWNVLAPGELRFDPYPFPMLTFAASGEALFLAIFILVSQRRSARLADRRHHLDLQISMLAEQEVTKVLELLEEIHGRLGLPGGDPEIDVLKQVTRPERIAEHIEHAVEEKGD